MYSICDEKLNEKKKAVVKENKRENWSVIEKIVVFTYKDQAISTLTMETTSFETVPDPSGGNRYKIGVSMHAPDKHTYAVHL